ncbi:hypothetical protein niasHT_026450 [Heterodera trifolii]|uniref:Uncharacterized protein n=1 Tax=Heterodera trifolii TaxID=157864 RepID=A0ABD2KJQ8_9BILA
MCALRGQTFSLCWGDDEQATTAAKGSIRCCSLGGGPMHPKFGEGKRREKRASPEGTRGKAKEMPRKSEGMATALCGEGQNEGKWAKKDDEKRDHSAKSVPPPRFYFHAFSH